MRWIPYDKSELNYCWKCSWDTARVIWYYCVASILPQSDMCGGVGEESKGNKQSSQTRQQDAEVPRHPSLQQEHLQLDQWAVSLNLGPSCTSASGHTALWRLGSLAPPLFFSSSDVTWSDTNEDLLLESLDWNVLLKKSLKKWHETAAAGRGQASCEERSLWHWHFHT